ncbi:CYTH domain-containing protein [Georgenia alba]|uniref:CYTH domain-containing protein n=1 Tax=Georgenia alba TaxID=2233858 RepID=A0ABW2Q2I4_9MICO
MSDTGYGDFEFERKFFVRSLPDVVLSEPDPVLIVQSYYLAAEGYALRVRLQAEGTAPATVRGDDVESLLEGVDFTFCALTVKGPEVSGTRYEAERELDVSVGRQMVRLGGERMVKHRYSVWLGTDGWVVDEFLGENAPLIVAECERGGPVTDLVIPDFCVTEVTTDPRFTNDALAVRPYAGWGREYEQELAVQGPRFLQEFGRNELGSSPH